MNWEKRTAQLHDYTGGFVRLRFDRTLDQKMRMLATDYVEVVGIGQFDARGEWKTLLVHQVTATRSHHQPFDLEAFLQEPNPKVFDPEETVTASEPFDVEDFIRFVHQGRDVQQEDSTD